MRAIRENAWTTVLLVRRAFRKIRIRRSLIEFRIMAWTPLSFCCMYFLREMS